MAFCFFLYILLESLNPAFPLCSDPLRIHFPTFLRAWWGSRCGWQGDWLQVQHAKYYFSSVFSPNEILAWILLESYQVAAFILAETLHCHPNLLFCALLLCRFESACCGGSRWFWAQPTWVLLKWQVRSASAASQSAVLENDFCCVQMEPISMGCRYKMPRGRASSHWPPLFFVSTYYTQEFYIFKGMKS